MLLYTTCTGKDGHALQCNLCWNDKLHFLYLHICKSSLKGHKCTGKKWTVNLGITAGRRNLWDQVRHQGWPNTFWTLRNLTNESSLCYRSGTGSSSRDKTTESADKDVTLPWEVAFPMWHFKSWGCGRALRTRKMHVICRVMCGLQGERFAYSRRCPLVAFLENCDNV